MSASTKAMKIQKARFKEIWESGWSVEKILEKKKKKWHTRAHTQVQRGITGRNRPRHPPFVLPAQVKGMKEIERRQIDRGERKKKKKERKGSCVPHRNTPNRTKTTHTKKKECVEVSSVTLYGCVAVWECVPFLNFFILLLWLPEVPRGQERILFLSRALLSYTRSPSIFFYFIHSLLVPSLSFSAALNGPLSLMSDWWMK